MRPANLPRASVPKPRLESSSTTPLSRAKSSCSSSGPPGASTAKRKPPWSTTSPRSSPPDVETRRPEIQRNRLAEGEFLAGPPVFLGSQKFRVNGLHQIFELVHPLVALTIDEECGRAIDSAADAAEEGVSDLRLEFVTLQAAHSLSRRQSQRLR